MQPIGNIRRELHLPGTLYTFLLVSEAAKTVRWYRKHYQVEQNCYFFNITIVEFYSLFYAIG